MGIAETFAETKRGAVKSTYAPDELRAMAYRYHRRKGVPARRALEMATADAADGKTRFASCAVSGWNPAFAAFGESGMRWIENPAECGLRFVGYADECARLNHTGWYLDSDGFETARGIVYQMPARNGAPVFVAGYADPFNGTKGNEWKNPACLSFSSVVYGESGWFSTDPRDNPECADAGRLADRITEIMAESEREYREVTDARQRFESLADDIKAEWSEWSALMRECRAMRQRAADAVNIAPHIAATIRARLASIRESILEMTAERETLASDYGSHDGWNDY